MQTRRIDPTERYASKHDGQESNSHSDAQLETDGRARKRIRLSDAEDLSNELNMPRIIITSIYNILGSWPEGELEELDIDAM